MSCRNSGLIPTNPRYAMHETHSERHLSNVLPKDTSSMTLIVRYHFSPETATDTVCSTQSGARTPCVPCKELNLNSRLFVFGMCLAFRPHTEYRRQIIVWAGTYEYEYSVLRTEHGNRPATTRDPPHLIRYRNREHLSTTYPFICFRVT